MPRYACRLLLALMPCAVLGCEDGSGECGTFRESGAPAVECSAGEPGCYVIGDWRVRGPTSYPGEATWCSGNDFFADECNCDRLPPRAGASAGMTQEVIRCPERETCVAVVRPSPIGPAGNVNVCRALCLEDSECEGDERCWAGFCLVPECLRDSDCDAEPCGRCISLTLSGHGGVEYETSTPTCAYQPW